MNLRKTYGLFNKFEAVKGITFCMKPGEVFAVLGHNGAGKTTAINVITGTTRASGGEVLAFDQSLTYAISEVQKMIGLCPQHSAIWEELTPRQHLKIFCHLKGVPWSEMDDEIEQRLKDVVLFDVIDKPAGKFSGGMKRRLSVAMACVGNPQIIILDEPTTGLDPLSKKWVWSSIQKLKKGKVVILTTHSMEEADLLGDRIGIMGHGTLLCIGTSLHLKNKFGLGYRINFSIDETANGMLKSEIKKRLPTGILLVESGPNVAFGVPTAHLDEVIPLAKWLEADKPGWIKEWSLSQTTLEEVFLKVSGQAADINNVKN